MSKPTSHKATVTLTGEREFTTTRVFDASRERVWKAMTTPELIARWWGRGNPLTVERYEPKRGGCWRFVERSEHGEHGFEGRFREVTAPERTVQSFSWDGMPGHVLIDTMVLEDLGDNRTRLTTVSLFHTQEERDGMLQAGMEGGQNESYQALDRLLASDAL